MGKYNKQEKRKNRLLLWATGALALMLLLWWAARLLAEQGIPVLEQPEQSESTLETTQPPATRETYSLDGGLTITTVGSYTGIYMEDGSDEVVTGVMMILLENGSGQDLQLARIQMEYDSMTAEFEVTNLPAGERVVLLERSRQSPPEERCSDIRVENLVFFSQPMDLMEEKLEIVGGDGYLDVRNISGEALTGDVYIYYKNSASDLLYGGITYRARIEDGLDADGAVRVLTGHFSEGSSRIVHVVGGG